jgi:LEA14-like dessication related protein
MNAARPLLAAAVLSLAACSKPEPPTVTPISGRVTSISTTGITVEAKLEAHNPNDFDLNVKSFTATVVLDNTYNIGTVTSPHAIKLPAKKKKQIEIPIALKWNDVASLAPLAMSNKDVPYEASGTVKVSAESIELELPFKVTGIVTHAQIMQAVGKSIPKVPGLPF